MADIKYYDVILKPVITEKSMNAMGDRKYTFMVHVDANKSMIKEAVEKMFPGTKVASVNTPFTRRTHPDGELIRHPGYPRYSNQSHAP